MRDSQSWWSNRIRHSPCLLSKYWEIYCEYFGSFRLTMPSDIRRNFINERVGNKWYTQELRFKNVILYYVVIGVCTTCWNEKKDDPFWRGYITRSSIYHTVVLITDSSNSVSKICRLYIYNQVSSFKFQVLLFYTVYRRDTT